MTSAPLLLREIHSASIALDAKPIQDARDLDRLFETAPLASEQLSLLGTLLANECGASLQMGPCKTRESAERKIMQELGGRHDLICDIVRAKIIVSHPEQVLQYREILSNRSMFFEKYGSDLRWNDDYFDEPKFDTGYRCLKLKIAVPVAEGETHIVELQVVAEQLEACYDETHDHMRAAQNILAANRHNELSIEDATRVAEHYGFCQACNGRQAAMHGYDALLARPELAYEPPMDAPERDKL